MFKKKKSDFFRTEHLEPILGIFGPLLPPICRCCLLVPPAASRCLSLPPIASRPVAPRCLPLPPAVPHRLPWSLVGSRHYLCCSSDFLFCSKCFCGLALLSFTNFVWGHSPQSSHIFLSYFILFISSCEQSTVEKSLLVLGLYS